MSTHEGETKESLESRNEKVSKESRNERVFKEFKNEGVSEEDVKKESESESEGIGPEPVVKKRRVLPFESIYKSNLPKAEAYERSYMHRDTVKFVLVAQKTNFIVTGSVDGHIKFWAKKAIGIEFVKHFRAHLGTIEDMAINNPVGSLLASISDDQSVKIFDIVNFDLINMFQLDFKPGCVEFCYSTIAKEKDPFPVLAVSDKDSNAIYTFDAVSGQKEPLQILNKIHTKPVVRMRFNPVYGVMVSVDSKGMLDYWMTHRADYKFPASIVSFATKLETDLYDLAKFKAIPHDVAFTLDGEMMAMICSDRKIRVLKFKTGKVVRVYDEGLGQLTADQQEQQLLPNMEFGRRIAVERDLEKTEAFRTESILFDDSGNFLIYPSLLGIKIIGWKTNTLVKLIGKGENFRPLSLSLIQSMADIKTVRSTKTAEMVTANNPTMESTPDVDPTLFVTGFRKNRFYMFSRREPDDSSLNSSEDGIVTGLERDVFNEKPSREEMAAASNAEAAAQAKRLGETAVIHTTKGDISVKLFPKDTQKTVENFVTHSRNGYYNGHIFHRVIKQFMIQTGDPTGTGTGGESIWGGEFEDEFVPHLKCDKPFMVCMANAGPNTNGSQFFITVVPTPWLNDKHTVFGQVTKGMDVVQSISKVRTQKSTDKPFDDVKILNINIK